MSFYLCLLFLLGFLVKIMAGSFFYIPTDSMYFTLLPSDNILVNKSIIGARIFNIWEATEEKEVEIHRLLGLGKVKRNDVLVFRYPYPHKNDNFSIHLQKCNVNRFGFTGRFHGNTERSLLLTYQRKDVF